MTGRSNPSGQTSGAKSQEASLWVQDQKTHGFVVKEGRTEIRFLDWTQSNHREVYEKYFKVIPFRSGHLEIDVLSGSSSPKNIEIQHTHKTEKLKEDQYHIRSRVTIPNATEGKSVEILEKSTRYDISNKSEDSHSEVNAHPRLATLGVVDKSKWFIVLHVLYPTEKLSFRADLMYENRAQIDTIKVHEFTESAVLEVEEPVHVIGTDEGTLQVLTWEKKNVRGGVNFVISWKWQGRGNNQGHI